MEFQNELVKGAVDSLAKGLTADVQDCHDRVKADRNEIKADTALSAYYNAISNKEWYSAQDIQDRLDTVASFGKRAELRAHELHLEFLIENRVAKGRGRRNSPSTDRKITERAKLIHHSKVEITRLKQELGAKTNDANIGSKVMYMNY